MAGCLRVTHPFATRNFTEIKFLVRLACVKHAASVRPEPGSNSPINFIEEPIRLLLSLEVVSLRSHLVPPRLRSGMCDSIAPLRPYGLDSRRLTAKELSIAFHNLGMFLTVCRFLCSNIWLESCTNDSFCIV